MTPLGQSRSRERLVLELQMAATVFVGTAAFPRLAYRLRWPTRLRGRRLVAYIGSNTAMGFAMRQAVLPRMKRHMEQHRKLVEQLGRQPTEDEYRLHFEALRRERRGARRVDVAPRAD